MSTPDPNSQTAGAIAAAGKYLTFQLGVESFGVSVLKVREIIRVMEITAVPQMPGYVKGVINLRGKVVPIVDLRLKFVLSNAVTTDRTCIVVVQIQTSAGPGTLTGFLVDAVEEVLNLTADDIEPTPDFGGRLQTDYILGMAKSRGRIKTLLDIDRVLSSGPVEPLAARLEKVGDR